MGAISLWFSATYNVLLHASRHHPEDKIEECITFVLIHASLYLVESDDEQDDKSATANTFDVSFGGGGSSSSLSDITLSVLATYNVVCCWIFTSARFLRNDPLSSDDMVYWENDPMLGMGGGDTNIDKESFVLHNSW